MKFIKFSRFTFYFVFFLLLIFFVLLISRFRNKFSSSLNSFSNSAIYTISIPINYSISLFESLDDLIDVYEINKDYKHYIYNNSTSELKVKNLEAENKALKKFAVLDDNSTFSSYRVSFVKVFQRVPNSWYNQLFVSVNKGSKITENSAVLVNDVLVGFTSDTSADKARVNFFYEQNNLSIPVKILSKTHSLYGVITSYDLKKDCFVISDITTSNFDISSDSEVVTSGLDGKFPENLKIGKISYVKKTGTSIDKILVKSSRENSNSLYFTVLSR